jgi:hypothetical protein
VVNGVLLNRCRLLIQINYWQYAMSPAFGAGSIGSPVFRLEEDNQLVAFWGAFGQKSKHDRRAGSGCTATWFPQSSSRRSGNIQYRGDIFCRKTGPARRR